MLDAFDKRSATDGGSGSVIVVIPEIQSQSYIRKLCHGHVGLKYYYATTYVHTIHTIHRQIQVIPQ